MKREQGAGNREQSLVDLACRLGLPTLLGVASVLAISCNRGESAQRPSEKAVAAAQQSAQRAADGPRAEWPNDGCNWIPVAEVEAILGKLAGPPRGSKTTCHYPVPMDSVTLSKRTGYRDMARDLNPKSEAARDTTVNRAIVTLDVDLRGDMTGERAGRMTGAMLANMFKGALGKNTSAADTTKQEAQPKPPNGWDVASVPRRNGDFRGRIGHLTVSIDEDAMFGAVPAEKKAALAARVRDRIPDLPFAYPFAGPRPTEPPSGPDPCGLLTRAEAESVLGKLLAPPYRSHDGGPYARPNGSSCAYYTAGHHVLVLNPRWRNGKQLFGIGRGVGSIVGTVAENPDREKADTLDGPWDDVEPGLDGTLAFLKGDQMLEVEYLTSSTDAAGAVKLARLALGRLTKAASP
jgi:hypothetical protein